jgi:hypothetical protein
MFVPLRQSKDLFAHVQPEDDVIVSHWHRVGYLLLFVERN